MFEQTMWIAPAEPLQSGSFALFRLDVALGEGSQLAVDVTASARYRLWVNGEPVNSGPAKGDLHVWYADSLDLSPWLRPGLNQLAVQVLWQDPCLASGCNERYTAPISIICPGGGHRLALKGRAGDVVIDTGLADWRVWSDNSFRLINDEHTGLLGAVTEHIDFRQADSQWKVADVSGWPIARSVEPVSEPDYMLRHGLLPHYRVFPRPIPLLFEHQDSFQRELKSSSGILAEGSLTMPAHQAQEIILDAGQIKVGYPRFKFLGGRDAQIELCWFEKFMKQGQNLRRDDFANGEVIGMRDSLILDGRPLTYEPFWPRTFRFLRLTIRTADEALRLEAPDFLRTGYPIKRESSVQSTLPWVEQLYDMCVETLQNCMLETYMDCPFYEQLQYLMDTRLQVLFHLSIAQDSALARQALSDFSRSMMPMGLLQGRYPTVYRQIISTFSLHFILMVWELYRHTGDADILLRYRAQCDRILEYYHSRLSERGLMKHPGFWAFVDWLPEWRDDSGTPSALRHGESTLISLMYAYALDSAAQINAHSGRPSLQDACQQRKAAVMEAVQRHCWDEQRGLYREGPDFKQYTQHAQAWAVLLGIGDRRCMEAALSAPDVLKVTFATSYEWFRALEQTGLYHHARAALQPWIDLIELGCKTCPETPGESRSDNHAWSALPMYELLRGVAGIRQAGIGWGRLRIAPQLLDLPDLKGEASTPLGAVVFDFRPNRYWLRLPAGVTAAFHHPDGRVLELDSGEHSIA